MWWQGLPMVPVPVVAACRQHFLLVSVPVTAARDLLAVMPSLGYHREQVAVQEQVQVQEQVVVQELSKQSRLLVQPGVAAAGTVAAPAKPGVAVAAAFAVAAPAKPGVAAPAKPGVAARPGAVAVRPVERQVALVVDYACAAAAVARAAAAWADA
jgi:hypothetical protein